MALNINTQLTNISDIAIPTSYARIAVINNFTGNKIDGVAQFFVSKEAYKAGKAEFNPIEVSQNFNFDYDRNTMSTDVLDLAHDAYINYLAEQGITAEKDLI